MLYAVWILLLYLTATAWFPAIASALQLFDRGLAETLSGWLVFLFVVPVFYWIPTRLSLLLPAIAIRAETISLRQEWTRTRGYFWKLFFGLCLCATPMLLIGGSIGILLASGQVPPGQSSNVAETIALVGLSAIFFLCDVIGIGYLSIAYRELSDESLPELRAR
ncbi:MAG: hypothetical protein AAF346_15595 [Pseudomonadota bacterium]